jgi:hypothetical protein
MWKLALAILFLSTGCAPERPDDPVTQKLIDHQLIQRKSAGKFEEFLKQEREPSSSAYVNALFQTEFRERFGEPVGYTQISYDQVQLTEDERKTIRMELSAYISKLKNAGLINDKQFETFQKKIEANEFIDVVQLLASLAEHVAFDEYMHPDRLKAFADTLESASIVSTRYHELIKTIENEELKRPIAFLKYCDKATIINKDDFPAEPQGYLEKLHRHTAAILPGLSFTDFTFEVVADSSSLRTDTHSYYFLISLKSDGRSYKQKSFYRLHDPARDEYFGRGIDQQEYYKIFNAILFDKESPYRLHEVKSYNGNAVDQQTFGIIALTEDQADILHRTNAYVIPSYESFTNNPIDY